MRNSTVLLSVVGLMVLTLLFTGGSTGTRPSSAQAQAAPPVLVRFVNALPAAGAVDIYVEGARLASGVVPGDGTPHLRFSSGEATVTMRPAGSGFGGTVVAARVINFVTTGGGYGNLSVVLQQDGFGQPTLVTHEDLLTPTRLDGARLQVIHAAPDGPSVDVVTDAGAVYLTSVGFGSTTASVDPPVGATTLTLSDGVETLTALFDVRLNSGFLYTLVVMPDGDGGLRATVLSAPVLPPPSNTVTQVQIVHAAPAVGAVDLYLDDAAILPSLFAGDVIVHTYYASGDYQLAVRNAGIPASAAAATAVPISITGEAQTIILSGDFGDGSFAVDVREDFVFSMTPDMARVRVINGANNGPLTVQLRDGDTLANILEPGASTAEITLAAGVYDIEAVIDDTAINGPIFLEAFDTAFTGGAVITVLAVNGNGGDPILRVVRSYLRTEAISLTAFAAAPPPTATPTPTATPSPTPLPPTLTPTPVTGTPAVAANQPLIVADVNINEGVNLQCREYPSTVARSINLIPAGARLLVLGYGGPLDADGELNVPLDPLRFSNPEAITDFEELWIQIDHFAEDGVQSRCWVRADFVLFYYYDGQALTFIPDPPNLFGFGALSPPIIARVAANVPGQVVGTGFGNPPAILLPTPTPLATSTDVPPPSLTPTITTTPDAALRGRVNMPLLLYERPDTNATVLREIPTGSVVVLIGRNLDGTLLNARYQVLGIGEFTGWVLADSIDVLDGGNVAQLPVSG